MIEKDFLFNIVKNPQTINSLDINDISNIFKEVELIFNKQNLLIELKNEKKNDEMFVIGDIHGNLDTLLSFIHLVQESDPVKVISLGDLVDRGEKQLECLIIMFVLKILYPERFYILRGNHETLEMNKYYGFYNLFQEKFHDKKKFEELLFVYNALPYCALINKEILCMHGGIPNDVNILKKLKGLKAKDLDDRIIEEIGEDLLQIMWNDPKEGEKGFTSSFRGPDIYHFGEDVFNKFMDVNNLKCLLRSHEVFPEGYRWFFKKRLLSIFSSANYRGEGFPNLASYAIIRNGKVIPRIINL